eukprot:scaffold18271_cov71-Phaeocystis_antarctica.AAC.1
MGHRLRIGELRAVHEGIREQHAKHSAEHVRVLSIGAPAGRPGDEQCRRKLLLQLLFAQLLFFSGAPARTAHIGGAITNGSPYD